MLRQDEQILIRRGAVIRVRIQAAADQSLDKRVGHVHRVQCRAQAQRRFRPLGLQGDGERRLLLPAKTCFAERLRLTGERFIHHRHQLMYGGEPVQLLRLHARHAVSRFIPAERAETPDQLLFRSGHGVPPRREIAKIAYYSILNHFITF